MDISLFQSSLNDFQQVLRNLIRFYWVLLGFTGFLSFEKKEKEAIGGIP